MAENKKLEIVFNHDADSLSEVLSQEVMDSDSPEAEQAKNCIQLIGSWGGENRDESTLSFHLLMSFSNYINGDKSENGSASRIAEAAYHVGIMKKPIEEKETAEAE